MQTGLERRVQSPYIDGRVLVQVQMKLQEARLVIRDSGQGFKGAKQAPAPTPGAPGGHDGQAGGQTRLGWACS